MLHYTSNQYPQGSVQFVGPPLNKNTKECKICTTWTSELYTAWTLSSCIQDLGILLCWWGYRNLGSVGVLRTSVLSTKLSGIVLSVLWCQWSEFFWTYSSRHSMKLTWKQWWKTTIATTTKVSILSWAGGWWLNKQMACSHCSMTHK